MMKINSKKSIVFVLGLSLLQTVTVSPIAYALEDESGSGDTSAETVQEGQNAQVIRMEERREARAQERRAAIEGRQENRQATIENRVGNMEERRADLLEKREDRQAASCERIITIGEAHFQKFSQKKEEFGQKFEDKLGVFEEKRSGVDADLNDIRINQDERRNKMYMKLEELAKTDEQKAALKKFQETVDEAVSDRRDAFNTAIEVFRVEVDKLVSSKKTTVSGAVDVYQESVKVAFEKAKAQCASGTDPQTVREALMTSLKDARGQLQESRQSFESIGDSIPALVATKKTALDKAKQDFRATMEKARVDLKAALQK